MTKTFWVEIWRKGGNVPFLQHGLTSEAAERLYNSAAFGWSVRRIGSSEGEIVKEEKQSKKGK